jgi:hypothetical protein
MERDLGCEDRGEACPILTCLVRGLARLIDRSGMGEALPSSEKGGSGLAPGRGRGYLPPPIALRSTVLILNLYVSCQS